MGRKDEALKAHKVLLDLGSDYEKEAQKLLEEINKAGAAPPAKAAAPPAPRKRPGPTS